MASTFRDAVREFSPPWLRKGRAEKVLYALALHVDLLVDATVAGVRARFPGVYSDESLDTIGRERRIRRGLTESNATYADRLVPWRAKHRVRGGPYELLAQIHAHYAPNNFVVDLLYYSGRRFRMDAAGNVSRSDFGWTPDANAARWARWWLIYQWPTAVVSDGQWNNGGTWDDGGVWDSTLTEAEVASIRRTPREWNAAHAQGRIVLLSPGTELWDFPGGTWGDAGVWGDPSPAQLSAG